MSHVLAAKFILERETKGAVRYQEIDEKDKPLDVAAAKIGTLYIRKATFSADAPKRIKVTVEAD
jgi:hypothetical protein